MKGITSVKLWRIPLESELYYAAREEKRRRDARADAEWQMEMPIFMPETPIMESLYQARQLYFRHQFEEDQNKAGAAAKYLLARVPESYIKELVANKDIQRQLGLDRQTGETEQTWRENFPRLMMYAAATAVTNVHARTSPSESETAAAIRTAAITPPIAQNSVVLNESLVSS
jgi:hypothetical protein